MGTKKKVGLFAGLTILITLFSGVAVANATQVTTYISQWYQGTTGSWRTSTGVAQTIQLYGCVGGPAGAPTPSSVDMELQRNNGLWPVSAGFHDQACATVMNYGTKASGTQYRYRLEGYWQGGSWQTGPFSASTVYINY